jgi:hypothetical protein
MEQHKPAPKVAVAIARELAGFLWAASNRPRWMEDQNRQWKHESVNLSTKPGRLPAIPRLPHAGRPGGSRTSRLRLARHRCCAESLCGDAQPMPMNAVSTVADHIAGMSHLSMGRH